MTNKTQIDTMLAPIKAMPTEQQLKFWRTFRVTHRRRIANTEAALCPELLQAVDELITTLRMQLAQGV